jgi:hypothetical protein
MISAREAASPETTSVEEASAAVWAVSMVVAFTVAALAAAIVKTALSVQETATHKEKANVEDIY